MYNKNKMFFLFLSCKSTFFAVGATTTGGGISAEPFFLYFPRVHLPSDYRCKPIISYMRWDASMHFQSILLPLVARIRRYVGVRHADNAIDLLRFRGENYQRKEQSVDVLLRNSQRVPEPFSVGEAWPAVCRLGRSKFTNLRSDSATCYYLFLFARYDMQRCYLLQIT